MPWNQVKWFYQVLSQSTTLNNILQLLLSNLALLLGHKIDETSLLQTRQNVVEAGCESQNNGKANIRNQPTS